MTLSLRFAAGSHKGMIREGNEDSGYAGPRLLAIADGMGGQAAGEVASSEVISTLVTLDDDVPGSDILTSLGTAVQRANDQLRMMVEEDPQLEGMGTTLTALLWTGQRLGLVHVGDSRAYLLRDGVLTQITQDHTWVQRLVDEGRITEEEATTHPQRSLLMRALGSGDHVEPDLSIREVRAGDRYLICSDGLSGVVSHQTLEDTLASYQGPQETVQELIQLALRGGGPDNITVIVADVLDVDGGDTLAGHLSDTPVIVGAVAENQAQLNDADAARRPSRQMEDLRQRPHGGVRRLSVELLEELRHLRLPASVDLGGLHGGAGPVEVRCLQIADEQPVLAEEEGVVVPAGGGEGRQHLGPDVLVARPVLLDPPGPDLEQEADPPHRRHVVSSPLPRVAEMFQFGARDARPSGRGASRVLTASCVVVSFPITESIHFKASSTPRWTCPTSLP